MIEETSDYWIYENKFIFKPEFNNQIDEYYELISNYDELIFSNYDDLNILLETKNNYNENIYENYIESKFNQPIDLLKVNLTQITFGYF
jgi:phage anti-repressor protein